MVPTQPGSTEEPAPILGPPPKPARAVTPELHQGWAQLTISTANALTDVYALALRHAKQYPEVTPADVRSFVLASFHKQGAPDVA